MFASELDEEATASALALAIRALTPPAGEDEDDAAVDDTAGVVISLSSSPSRRLMHPTATALITHAQKKDEPGTMHVAKHVEPNANQRLIIAVSNLNQVI